MDTDIEKARLLIDALPYFKEFSGRHVVIKYGGHAMMDENLKKSFALNMVLLRQIGIFPVIIHGGGPQIGKLLDRLGLPTTFKQGYRVTDDETMSVVEMVLVGLVNKQIVNYVNRHGAKAVGLSGKDGDLIKASKFELTVAKKDAPPEIIDLGRVGEVRHINTRVIYSLEKEGFIPIIAPVGVDDKGHTYNINADSVAGAVAVALGAKRLHLLTDVPGILDAEGKIIHAMRSEEAIKALDNGLITGGMIPKVKCCLASLFEGVECASIIDGRVENSTLLELFTAQGIGTQLTR